MGTTSEDPLFRELLTVWGVDCANWKPVAAPKAKAKELSSPVQASTESEAAPSPASTTATSSVDGGDAKDRD